LPISPSESGDGLRRRKALGVAITPWRSGLATQLFLDNNLHVAHHRQPTLPWHQIPAVWRTFRRQIDPGSGMLFRGGYAEIFARYLRRSAGPVEHPGFEARP
jgi:fatty acid desaturase